MTTTQMRTIGLIDRHPHVQGFAQPGVHQLLQVRAEGRAHPMLGLEAAISYARTHSARRAQAVFAEGGDAYSIQGVTVSGDGRTWRSLQLDNDGAVMHFSPGTQTVAAIAGRRRVVTFRGVEAAEARPYEHPGLAG